MPSAPPQGRIFLASPALGAGLVLVLALGALPPGPGARGGPGSLAGDGEAAAAGPGGPARSQAGASFEGGSEGVPGRADYVIEARLDRDPEGGAPKLTGRLTVRYRNDTDRATGEAWFHLYHNAYSSNRSTHLIEARGDLRGHDLQEGFGWQRVTAVRSGGADLFPSFRYRTPDDDNQADRTVFSVDLPRPLGPGESVELEVEWESLVPRVRRRTGYKDDFLFMAHWFPKLGVFEGERGWNCHQFHASTEFYSTYGTYDVTLDLPAEYENHIGASGRMVSNPRRIADRVITHFEAPSPPDRQRADATGRIPLVHGFAWTADPDFVKQEAVFHYDTWAAEHADEVDAVQRALGPDVDLRLRNVQITLLIQPEHLDQAARHLDATKAALFFYGLWFGEYPYEHLTVVDPAWGAGAAGGMEYPTLFTCGTQIGTRAEMHRPESVTVHEAGHQFWYGLVGNNEFEAAWLDEGLNSYADSEVLIRRYGERQAYTWYSGIAWPGVEPAPGPGGTVLASALSVRAIPLPWVSFDLTPLRASGLLDFWRDQPQLCFVQQPTDPRWSDRSRYLRDPDRDSIDTPGWLYADGGSYGTNSYPRTAVALRSLEGLIGRDRFLRGMRAFSETWRYRHPYPKDFFRSFQEGAGVDVGWYLDQMFRGTGTVDWSVEVEQRRLDPPMGFHQAAPGEPFEALPHEPDEREDKERVELPWQADVSIVRRGELLLPLTYELRFDDGTVERHVWTREQQQERRWLRIEHLGPRKLEAVLLDPDRSWYVDLDMSDNAWFDQVDKIAPVRWSERVFNRYLHLLHWQSGLGG